MTDKILIDRAVVEQALEALASYCNTGEIDGADDLLASFLAERDLQPQVEQEPVAWIENIGGGIGYNPYHDAARKLPDGVRFDLYTHQQPPRQPLTDDEIEKLFPYTHEWLYEIGLEEATKFARSIEAAHGIGGEA